MTFALNFTCITQIFTQILSQFYLRMLILDLWVVRRIIFWLIRWLIWWRKHFEGIVWHGRLEILFDINWLRNLVLLILAYVNFWFEFSLLIHNDILFINVLDGAICVNQLIQSINNVLVYPLYIGGVFGLPLFEQVFHIFNLFLKLFLVLSLTLVWRVDLCLRSISLPVQA